MEVTAWNNGKHHKSGAGYGIKINLIDRDRYFKKSWGSVYLKLPNGVDIEINTDKASFWNDSCRELISKEIGKWLIDNKKAPWPSGSPPKFHMNSNSERHFVLHENET